MHERLLLGSSGVSGGPHWIATFGASSGSDLYTGGVTVDASGNVYTVSWQTAGSQAHVICKYNSAGVLQWQARTATLGSRPRAFDIAVSSSGNVYFCGNYGDYNSAGSNRNIVIHKFDSSGNCTWRRNITDGANWGVATGIKVDSSENIYIGGIIANSDVVSQYVAKLNSSGTPLWHRVNNLPFSGVNSWGFGCAIDSSSNVYVAGYYEDIFGAGLVKYDASGNKQWHRQLDDGSLYGTVSWNVATDSSGNAYVCGKLGGSLNDAMVAKYDSGGTCLWARGLGVSGSMDIAFDVATDASSNVFICGQTNAGVFLAKYNTSGSLQWQRNMNGTTNTDAGSSVATDASGNAYLLSGSDTGQGLGFFPVLAKLPGTGELTGTYSVGSYSAQYTTGSLTPYNAGLAQPDQGFVSGTPSMGGSTSNPSSTTTTFNSAVKTL